MNQDDTSVHAGAGSNGAGGFAPRPKPDRSLDPAGEAGWYLQRERERRGLSLEMVSDATGVHPYHLEAIEHGDLTRLPSRGEAVSMIGCYAQSLGFEPQPLIMHYAGILPAGREGKPHPASPGPLSSAAILRFGRFPKLPKFELSSIPGGAGGLAALCLAAVTVFGGAGLMLGGGKTEYPDQLAGIQDNLATSSTGGQAAGITVSEEALPDALAEGQAKAVDPALATAEELSVDEAASPAETDTLGAFIEENVTKPAKAKRKKGKKDPEPDETSDISAAAGEVKLTAGGRMFGAENAEARLVLKARAPVWVRIEDNQGNVVMTQMLMKGDTYRVPGREGLMVIARDGGLLAYIIDGEEKGVLGPPGEILVGRSLDIQELGGNT